MRVVDRRQREHVHVVALAPCVGPSSTLMETFLATSTTLIVDGMALDANGVATDIGVLDDDDDGTDMRENAAERQ